MKRVTSYRGDAATGAVAMKKQVRKLRLNRETLQELENGHLGNAAGATGRLCPITVTTFGCATGDLCETCLGCK
jgi:hypothetical protein